MTPSRLRKRLSRALMVSWREQPTRYDIEALQANIRRVGLVVRVRWVVVGVLVLYSLLAGLLYTTRIPASELTQLMLIPACALGLVILYNSFYALNYRRLGNIAVWNNLQLALDALVVTVLVYFSGGVNSWFWSMYALFILEATAILPRSRDAWLHSLFSCALLGIVEFAELGGLIPHVPIPFAEAQLHADPVFVAVRYSWQVAVLLGMAWIATLLVGEFRREISARSGQTLVDTTTGLYSRSYFLRAAAAEVRRAQRDDRMLHVMLVDIDRFGDFNGRFGIDAGDRLLKSLATSMSATLAASGDLTSSLNVIARFGGEEFVILYTEDMRLRGAPGVHDAVELAALLRAACADVSEAGAGVTVSIGVATMPADATTVDGLLDQADAALVCAIERGGNSVVLAEDCDPVITSGSAHRHDDES